MAWSEIGSEKHTAVIYATRTGTCEQYARWVCDRRDADLFGIGEAKLTRIREYQTLIWILPVYDGRLEGLDSLQRIYPKLMKVSRSYADDLSGPEGEKRVAVLAVGLSSEEEAASSGILELPGVLSEVPVFYARGRFSPETAGPREKLRITILKRAALQDPQTVPAWAEELMAKEAADETSPAYIEPLLDVIDGRM